MNSSRQSLLDEATQRLTRRLMDDGKLIEAGWIGLRVLALPKDAPPAQLEELRTAFFAGAQHLWSSNHDGAGGRR